MSAPHGSDRAPPPAGETLARADDYLSGHMNDAEAAVFEDELFAAPETAPEAAFVDRLARLLALFDTLGGFADGGTRAQVDAFRAAGARVHFVDLGGGGGPIPFPRWGAGIDLVVARLGVDLRGHGLVDVEVETSDGRPIKTFRDVACDPTDGALYAICQEPLARLAFGKGSTVARVIETKAGRRETVAVYQVTPG